MSSTDEGKSAGKSGRRNRKGDRRQKPNAPAPESPAPLEMQSAEPAPQVQPEPVQARVPETDPQPAVREPIDAVTELPEPAPTAAPSPAAAPAPAEPAMAEPSPVSLQTIANAYRDYTRKSFEEFGSFFEQLSGVRSLDKAMEVQTEFVKRAYESSVAESRKIRELHSKLARQTFEPFGGLVGKTPETHGKS